MKEGGPPDGGPPRHGYEPMTPGPPNPPTAVARTRLPIGPVAVLLLLGPAAAAADAPAPARAFVDAHCVDCHNEETREGGLDLSALRFDPADAPTFATWVKVHDRTRDGEMPPKKRPRPEPAAVEEFLAALAEPLAAADRDRTSRDGRAALRRLNRYEYENTLRDLLDAPWLQVRDTLPEDGEAHRFNKTGGALDVSHVQMARYLEAADRALRDVAAAGLVEPRTARFYARDQPTLVRRMKGAAKSPRLAERSAIPLLGFEAQPDVQSGKLPVTAGAARPDVRDREAFGLTSGNHVGNTFWFDGFKAPAGGRYKVRFSAYSFWAGPGPGELWWKPDRANTSRGRRPEPVTVYATSAESRRLGAFDAGPDPAVHELDVVLLAGESIKPDPARLFRSRPGWTGNPLATREGLPGVAFRWMEVEGPLPPAGRNPLFGDLPVKADGKDRFAAASAAPEADAERLLRAFLARAYRRPAPEGEARRLLAVVRDALATGSSFADALFAGYTAALCSPEFLYLRESPGELDGSALATRLSYFLWNSPPDTELRALAESGALKLPAVLRAQTDRLLADPKSRRFVDAFLDYWLDLRTLDANAPDAALYPDYYLDDLLAESANEETRLFFAELIRGDLPARNVVASDFAVVNERVAAHYGLPPVGGVALRRVALPPDSPRGGLMTQASVLKVTANGTTTSPVLRGAWVSERLLGKPAPPPPPGVPAVEPDTRGATTIREQLAKHRSEASCGTCHAGIDPPGFALENFDVFGGWRDRYRAVGDAGDPVSGFGKNGLAFAFHPAKPVDPAGDLPDGRTFKDVRDLKRLVLADERQLARNLARQFVVYATGAPVGFGDRAELEALLDRAAARGYGVRTLIHEVVQSQVFRCK